MDTTQILAKLKKILAEQLCRQDLVIELTTNPKESLGTDSLDDIEIIMAIEEYFDIEITDEQASKIVTVGDMVNAIHTNL